METIKANILKAISEEHKSTYDFADAIVKSVQIDKSVECKTASLIFNAITRFADSRLDICRQLDQLEKTIQSERTRLCNGSHLDLGWINPSRFEETVQESKKLWHEVHTLSYLIGLTGDEITGLANKIHSLTEYHSRNINQK
jgi:hypothetical protein